MKGKLVLETGEVFPGTLLGRRPRMKTAEVVFSTAMTGYQEMLTDPSFCEQIIVCTVPHVGNTGINPWDMESRRVQAAGLVATSICETPASWRSHETLPHWLDDAEVPLLHEVETRALVMRLRDAGVVMGWVGPADVSEAEIKKHFASAPRMSGRNLVDVVTTQKPYPWKEGSTDLFAKKAWDPQSKKSKKVAVLDFGVKTSILRQLVDVGMTVQVFPARTKPSEILSWEPQGVFLSNGPGDPSACGEIIENIKALLGKKPIFGICMGHQLLAQALGARTYKMPFGHRGINHPVKNQTSGQVEITSHNHGFAVDAKSLPSDVRCTHLSLNDQTVEGLESTRYKAFSVQYHPESCPGPRDSGYLMRQFAEMMSE